MQSGHWSGSYPKERRIISRHLLMLRRMPCFEGWTALQPGEGHWPCAVHKAHIACHLKIPFRDMLDQELYEVDDRVGLLHKDIALMPVVMESDIFPVIGVDTGKCDDRAPQVAADIFDDGIGIGKGRLCIDIIVVFIFVVDKGFGLFEGGADPFSISLRRTVWKALRR